MAIAVEDHLDEVLRHPDAAVQCARHCLVVGISGGLWCLPMLLLSEGVPDGYPWPLFFLLSMFSLAVLLTWAYNMTRSRLVLIDRTGRQQLLLFILPVLPAWWGWIRPA